MAARSTPNNAVADGIRWRNICRPAEGFHAAAALERVEEMKLIPSGRYTLLRDVRWAKARPLMNTAGLGQHDGRQGAAVIEGRSR